MDGERSFTICEFSDRTKQVLIQFAFAEEEELFFALVREMAFDSSPGFEPLGLTDEEGKTPSRTRVRAIAIDLATLKRKDIRVSEELKHFFLDERYGRVFCYVPVQPPYSLQANCTILSLPNLKETGSYAMALESPWLNPWRRPVAVSRDVLAFAAWRKLFLWEIGLEPPQELTLPPLSNKVTE